MWETIDEAIKLAKDHGLGVSGVFSILVFALIAKIAGRGAKVAVNFVRGLLETSSQLRREIKTQLDDATNRLRQLQLDIEAEQGISRNLRNELEGSQREMRRLMDKLLTAESQISTLKVALKLREDEVERLRRQIESAGSP